MAMMWGLLWPDQMLTDIQMHKPEGREAEGEAVPVVDFEGPPPYTYDRGRQMAVHWFGPEVAFTPALRASLQAIVDFSPAGKTSAQILAAYDSQLKAIAAVLLARFASEG